MDGISWKLIRHGSGRVNVIVSPQVHVLKLLSRLFRFGVRILLYISQSHKGVADRSFMGVLPGKPWAVAHVKLAKTMTLQIVIQRIGGIKGSIPSQMSKLQFTLTGPWTPGACAG